MVLLIARLTALPRLTVQSTTDIPVKQKRGQFVESTTIIMQAKKS